MGGVTAKGRKPEVTQASSVLSHWITEYIHVFCPYGPAVGCSNLLLADLVRLKTCRNDGCVGYKWVFAELIRPDS